MSMREGGRKAKSTAVRTKTACGTKEHRAFMGE